MLAAAVVVAGGCGEDSGSGALTVHLDEQNSSGQSGTAMFTSLDGGRTRIVLELTNPPDVSQPAHVHDGTCDDLGEPVVSLTDVMEGRSETEVEMPLERLSRGDLLVHAHKSAAAYDVSVACAPIEAAG
jgi:hypothetical protein